jgi:hypothetical protein
MTKLKELNPEQRAKFYRFIDRAVAQDLTAGQVQDLLAKEIGKAFGERMIQRYMEKRRHVTLGDIKAGKADVGDVLKEENGSEDKELTLESERVVTLEDALKKGNVDLNKWDVERWIVNSWEVGAKGPDKRIRVTPLWQVKVWLKAKKGWNPTEFRDILLKDMRKLAPSYVPIERNEKPEPLLAELSIFDAHFGKLAWSPETGQDYDIKICKNRYMKAARDLLGRAAIHNPERIVYVVGNDFFHVDHKGQTTSGTEMDMDGRWQKAFRIGKDCCVTIAEEASQIAPVDILVVPGNHDREKAFCLGEVLDARFHNNHEINVMNDPDPFVYYRWGKVLLGFNHGEEYMGDKKRADLPIQMSTDRALDWSETVWREWHLGHFHSEDEMVWKYRSTKQIRDLTVRVLPSLSSTDAWHRLKGYASPIAAECHMYHKKYGRWQYLVHHTEG